MFNVRHPLAIVVLSVLAAMMLDAVIFRSGLYLRLVPPVTTSAKLFSMVRAEEGRLPTSRPEVLITGNSRMEFGFSDRLFNEQFVEAPVRPIKVAVPGSDLKWWYYILKDIDPHQNRYTAIVLCVTSYQAEPLNEDAENWYYTVQSLAPILRINQISDFVSTFDSGAPRERVWKKMIMVGRGTGLEVFIPAWRAVERLARGDASKNARTVEALRVSNDGTIISYPDHFTAFDKKEANLAFVRPPEGKAIELTSRNAKFQERWLRRIADLYRGSLTRLIVVQLPRWPFPLPSMTPIQTAPNLRNTLGDASNLTFVDDDYFSSLEEAKYFRDVFHVNDRGSALLTERLGRYLVEELPRK